MQDGNCYLEILELCFLYLGYCQHTPKSKQWSIQYWTKLCGTRKCCSGLASGTKAVELSLSAIWALTSLLGIEKGIAR